MFRLARAGILLAVFLIAPWFTARADEARTALVIGNTRYAFAPLVNPGHDAADIADALRGAGFAVDLVLDAGKAKMLESIGRFGDTLAHRKGVGFFYWRQRPTTRSTSWFLMPAETIRSGRPASVGCRASTRATGCSYPSPPSRERSLLTGMTATAPTPNISPWRLQRRASVWRACSREP